MNWITVVAGIGLLAATVNAHGAACELPDSAVISSVVRVSDTKGVTASGVVIGTNLVLTAAHAIDDGATMRIAPDGGARRAATVIAIDLANDLALLSADTHGIRSIDVSNTILRAGELVWAAGYPRNTGMHISEGQFRKLRDGRLEASSWIDSGHSGGALFHCRDGLHSLAGIVHGYVAKIRGGEYVNTGRSVSVSAATVTEFLDQSNIVALAR